MLCLVIKKLSLTIFIQINGETLFTFDYQASDRVETVFNRRRDELLSIKYDASGRPAHIRPRAPFDALNITYDRLGHMTQWSVGELNIARVYDEKTGRVVERRLGGGRVTYRYLYKNSNKVT